MSSLNIKYYNHYYQTHTTHHFPLKQKIPLFLRRKPLIILLRRKTPLIIKSINITVLTYKTIQKKKKKTSNIRLYTNFRFITFYFAPSICLSIQKVKIKCTFNKEELFSFKKNKNKEELFNNSHTHDSIFRRKKQSHTFEFITSTTFSNTYDFCKVLYTPFIRDGEYQSMLNSLIIQFPSKKKKIN